MIIKYCWYDDYKNKWIRSIEETAWWIHLLDWVVGMICEMAYSTQPWIAVPFFILKRWGWDDEKKSDYRLWEVNELYGGLGGLFHHYCHEPVFHFCWVRTKRNK